MTQRRIYQNEFPYFITFLTKDKFKLFKDIKKAKLMMNIIVKTTQLKQYDIFAYQIMPDHIHLLVGQNNIFSNHIARPSEGALYFKKGSAGRDACARGGYNISQLIHTIKLFYCDQIRDKYDINYPVFQPRFYTRITNTRSYLCMVIKYIQHNLIKEESSGEYHCPPYQYFNKIEIEGLL